MGGVKVMCSATHLLDASLMAVHPELLRFSPVYAVLLSVNGFYAWRRQERALVNDLASVVQSGVMVFVVGIVSGAPVTDMEGTFVVVLGYFTGTVFYLKTMIRERGSIVYRRVSMAYHATVFVLVAWWNMLFGVLFGLALLRARLLPGRGPRPKQVGFWRSSSRACCSQRSE